MKLDRRIGKFSVSLQLLEDRQLMRELMSRLIIVRAEMMWHGPYIEYTAICEDWPEVSEGEIVPTYLPLIERTAAGNLIIKMTDRK